MPNSKSWIKKVVSSPKFKKGSLTKTAKAHGAIKKSNGIDPKWLKKAAAGKGVSPTTAKRARLAITLKGMKRK